MEGGSERDLSWNSLAREGQGGRRARDTIRKVEAAAEDSNAGFQRTDDCRCPEDKGESNPPPSRDSDPCKTSGRHKKRSDNRSRLERDTFRSQRREDNRSGRDTRP